MLIMINGRHILDKPSEKKSIYINPLHVTSVAELDDNTCKITTTCGDDYVAKANVEKVAIKIDDVLEDMR